MDVMDPAVQAIFFGAAVVVFVIAALLDRSLIAAGLALATFVAFWNAMAYA